MIGAARHVVLVARDIVDLSLQSRSGSSVYPAAEVFTSCSSEWDESRLFVGEFHAAREDHIFRENNDSTPAQNFVLFMPNLRKLRFTPPARSRGRQRARLGRAHPYLDSDVALLAIISCTDWSAKTVVAA